MPDRHTNFAVSTVATAPSPATTGTSLVVAAGEGTRFPDPASVGNYNCTIWPAGAIPTPANAEIVRVTAKSTDTLTIDREEEGTSARTVVVGDYIAATITKKTLTDAEGRYQALKIAGGNDSGGSITYNVNNTSYVAVVQLGFNIDLDQFPFTDYRIMISGNSNAGGQTVTVQLATVGAPGTPIHTGGDDIVITNTGALWDSGWKSRDDGATGTKEFDLALKGSNSTVDLVAAYIEVHFRYVPS